MNPSLEKQQHTAEESDDGVYKSTDRATHGFRGELDAHRRFTLSQGVLTGSKRGLVPRGRFMTARSVPSQSGFENQDRNGIDSVKKTGSYARYRPPAHTQHTKQTEPEPRHSGPSVAPRACFH